MFAYILKRILLMLPTLLGVLMLTFAVVPGEDAGTQLLLETLIRKGMDYTEGEIAYHLPLRHPALKLFQDLGFKRQFVELRFSPEKLKAEA